MRIAPIDFPFPLSYKNNSIYGGVMKVDSFIPIPSARTGRKRKYPFYDMSIGDSVFYGNEPGGTLSNPALAAYNGGKRYGMKFVARSEDGGVRIWRVA